MKNKDVLRIALFSLALLLIVALLYVVTSPLPIMDNSGEITRLKAQISALDERIKSLETDAS